MASNQELYDERLNRLNSAVRLEKTDRTPLVIKADCFAARQLGVKQSEFITDPALSNETMVKYTSSFENVDGSEGICSNAYLTGCAWNSNMKLPGKELDEGTLFQVDEAELMTLEDYDRILEIGWDAWRLEFWQKHMPDYLEKMGEILPMMGQFAKNFIHAGIVPYAPIRSAGRRHTGQGCATPTAHR